MGEREMSLTEENHVGHEDPNIAFHVEWGFRRESLRWQDGKPTGVNLHPVATEFYGWLRRQGHFSIFTEKHRQENDAYTNPYTFQASTIAAILSEAINDSHSLATATVEKDGLSAEIDRIRNYNEQVLYVARLCEALIKQLLFCTRISKRHYKNASLGGLLSTECLGCKGSNSRRHKLSLMGSLAHRYHLCGEFEHCLLEHLKIVGRRRNVEAAHAQTTLPKFDSAVESRALLKKESIEVGNELVHMLKHISEIETRMIDELESTALDFLPNDVLLIRPSRKESN